MYECNGVPVVKKCVFFSKHPWLILFNINSFKKELLKELDELPVILHLLGKKYVLAGYSLHRPGHFVSVVYWQGKNIDMMAWDLQITPDFKPSNSMTAKKGHMLFI